MRADDVTTESPGPVSTVEVAEDSPSMPEARTKAEDKLCSQQHSVEDLEGGAKVLRKKRKIVSEFTHDFLSHPEKLASSMPYAGCPCASSTPSRSSIVSHNCNTGISTFHEDHLSDASSTR